MPKHQNLEEFIIDYFGTKELAARRLKVSRFTLYRWLARPDSIQLRYFHRLSQISNTELNEIIELCTPRHLRANDTVPGKITNAYSGSAAMH